METKVEENARDPGTADDGASAVAYLNYNFVRVWINFGSAGGMKREG